MTPTFVHTTVTSSGVLGPLLGGVVLVLVALAIVVVAPRGEYRVVSRRGTVRRVAGPRPRWRVPGLETVESVPAVEHDQPLLVRATTRDGEDVVVLADATVRFHPPAVGQPAADPWTAGERIAAEAVRSLAASVPLTGLRAALRPAEASLAAEIAPRLRAAGVVLVRLEVVEVGLPVHDSRPRTRGPDR